MTDNLLHSFFVVILVCLLGSLVRKWPTRVAPLGINIDQNTSNSTVRPIQSFTIHNFLAWLISTTECILVDLSFFGNVTFNGTVCVRILHTGHNFWNVRSNKKSYINSILNNKLTIGFSKGADNILLTNCSKNILPVITELYVEFYAVIIR